MIFSFQSQFSVAVNSYEWYSPPPEGWLKAGVVLHLIKSFQRIEGNVKPPDPTEEGNGSTFQLELRFDRLSVTATEHCD